MDGMRREDEPVLERSSAQRPTAHSRAARNLTLAGLILAVAGPALALGTLLVSVDVEEASSFWNTVLATAHVGGLLAGVLGGVLVLAGLVWWASSAITAAWSKRRQPPAIVR